MPTRAETLMERRRHEALLRARERRTRRRGILELLAVGALSVPVILATLSADRRADDPIIVGKESFSAIAPRATTPATVTGVVPPAPVQVREIADEHGGTRRSRWIPRECRYVADLVRQHGMPEWMTSVAWRESRCQRTAKNFNRRTADQSYGLFQINVLGYLWEESRDRCGLARPEELLDAHTNVACAAALYRVYGYQPWDSGNYFRR